MTNNYIEVYPVGTKVIFGEVDAVITGFLVRGTTHDNVQYECQWFNDGLQSDWIDQLMIETKNEVEKIKIGF